MPRHALLLACLMLPASLWACRGQERVGPDLPSASTPQEQVTLLRARALVTLEKAYSTIEDRRARQLFDLAIRDLEQARAIYFRLLGELPAHLQAPLEGEIEQVQKILRQCYSERPQLPIRP